MGNKHILDNDPSAVSRKKDHIELAFASSTSKSELDKRFCYEPMLSGFGDDHSLDHTFLGKTFRTPIWVSSMTGGTKLANTINKNLAKACAEFGMGMGLGSCRQLLYSDEHLNDFNIRPLIQDQPLYANLGIAQVEQLVELGKVELIKELIKKLQADGLIIHVNPLQEWLQPEGDTIKHSPILTIKNLLDQISFPVIVKEVGQGFGKKSMEALLKLPLAAIDFAAGGGTNFSRIEIFRKDEHSFRDESMAFIGHSAEEMVDIANELKNELGNKLLCKEIIISGGIKDYLDGYYLTSKLELNSIYGKASSFLKYAQEDYAKLQEYTESQIKGLKFCNAYLTIK